MRPWKEGILHPFFHPNLNPCNQEHMTLGNRMQSGLDVLVQSSSITAQIKAVGSLEVHPSNSEPHSPNPKPNFWRLQVLRFRC